MHIPFLPSFPGAHLYPRLVKPSLRLRETVHLSCRGKRHRYLGHPEWGVRSTDWVGNRASECGERVRERAVGNMGWVLHLPAPISTAHKFPSELALCSEECQLQGPADLRRGLRMFSPARLTAASQRGNPDVVSSSCGRKHSGLEVSLGATQLSLLSMPPEHGHTHVIRPGPGVREISVTSWPLAFSSWVRAVPMKPVPPPDQKMRGVYPPGGLPSRMWPPSLAPPHRTSAFSPPSCPLPAMRAGWNTGSREIRPLGLGGKGQVACEVDGALPQKVS